MVQLLRELRRHGVRHQRWRMLLRRSLCLGEGEWGVSRTSLCATLRDSKLLGLEILACKGCSLVVKVGLSITIVAASSEAVAGAAAGVAAPIASILRICAKGFIWSVVKTSTIIPVPKTAEITPSRIPIPTVISEVTTSASP